MYNTKAKFITFIILSLLCIASMVVSALFYVELQGNEIFGIIDAKPSDINNADIGTVNDTFGNRRAAYALITLGFTLSTLLFCAAISIFVYYIIAATNNHKLIKLIRELKEQYAIKHNISKEEIDAGLLEIRDQIRKFEKTNVKPINEVEIKKGKKEKKAKGNDKEEAKAAAPAQAFPAAAPAAPTAPLA